MHLVKSMLAWTVEPFLSLQVPTREVPCMEKLLQNVVKSSLPPAMLRVENAVRARNTPAKCMASCGISQFYITPFIPAANAQG